MSWIVPRVIFIGLLASWPSQGKYMTEKENWPNLKCHPATEMRASNQDSEYMFRNGIWYKDCIEKRYNFRYTVCPKACMLKVLEVLTKDKSTGTYIIDVDTYIDFFAEELGYDPEKPEPAHKQLMDKMRSGLNDCKSKHKEYEGLKSMENVTCKPFDNFLKCFDKTIGC